MLPFGCNQQKLDLVMKLGEPFIAVIAVASMLDVLEPVTLTRAERPNDVFREIAFRRKLVEPLDRCLDPLPPSLVLLDSIGVALTAPGMGEAERADHRGQQQALANQRHQDDGKRQEENQIAVGKRLAVRSCKRDRQRCRERDDTANSGEGQHERPLPGRRRISALERGKEPARKIGCGGIVTPLRACGPGGGSVAKGMKKISYRGYRFPPEIIQQAIWLYLRFTLSLRDVEDLLAERGIMVSYETVRRWVNHFGPMIAADLRKRRPKPHTTWHLDEVYLKIAGRMVYLWRAVDAEGEVLDVLVQSRRNKRAALKLMRKLLKKYGFVPDKLVTDDLRSYAAAASDLGITRRHERGRWRNNRAENSHQPTHDDENTKCRVSQVSKRGQPKDFLSTHAATYNTFNVQRHLTSARTHRAFRASAMQTWREAVALGRLKIFGTQSSRVLLLTM